MAEQDAPQLPLEPVDESATPAVPAGDAGGGSRGDGAGGGGAGGGGAGDDGVETDLEDFYENLVDPDSGTDGSEDLGDLLKVDELREGADKRAAERGYADIEFDPDGVQRAIDKLQERRDALVEHRRNIFYLNDIHRREDTASAGFARIANQGGNSYIDALQADIEEFGELIELAESMKEERQRFEDEAVSEIGKHG